MIIVSTDGSCLRNPGGAIGWAWVDHQGGGSDSGGAATGTNQVAELRAVLEAILAHPGDEHLLIESDSLYAIKCASEWIHGWRNNGWRTSNGNPVKNAELVAGIDRAIASRPGPVRFRWVRGHVGNYFNERADVLAGEAARRAAAAPREARHAETVTTTPAVTATTTTTAAATMTTTAATTAAVTTAAATTTAATAGKAVAAGPQALTLF